MKSLCYSRETVAQFYGVSQNYQEPRTYMIAELDKFSFILVMSPLIATTF